MSGFGRGRGRGRASSFSKDAPKPGGLSSSESAKSTTTNTTQEVKADVGLTIDLNQISQLVQSLSLEADTISKDMVSNAVIKYADSEAHNEEILRVLYIRILQDWHHAKQMAYICSKLVKVPELGVKFRNSLVRRIQSDYGNKEIDREEKPRTFVACIAFLCQVLYQVRGVDGQPFKPLVVPVYNALEMLVDEKATDKEMDLAVSQLSDIGSFLQALNAEKMCKLMRLVREKILDIRGSIEGRTMMLKLLETYAGKWTALQDEDYYNEPVVKNGKCAPTTSTSATPQSEEPATKPTQTQSSPKRVSFSLKDNTVSSPSPPPLKTESTDWGVWPTQENENTKKFSYNWSSPPETPTKNDNDAGVWQNPSPAATESWD